VTNGVMVGILLSEGAHWASALSNIPTITVGNIPTVAHCRGKQRRIGAVYCDRLRDGRDIIEWRSLMGSFTQ
jgi:hypothetical protein